MTIELIEKALIDGEYFYQMWDGGELDSDKLNNTINAVSTSFELFCNRPLKEFSYTYDPDDEEDNEGNPTGIYYVPEYTIFDGPQSTFLYLPTYPIDSITELLITDVEIIPSTTYLADVGYMLYEKTGKIIYDYGFDYGYLKNVKIKWKGGYPEDSIEMAQLKFLCFSAIKDLLVSEEHIGNYESEKIGNYSYKIMSPFLITKLQGLSPNIFYNLKKYRREVFA